MAVLAYSQQGELVFMASFGGSLFIEVFVIVGSVIKSEVLGHQATTAQEFSFCS